jgi:VIT1/CCC1 family predicted Fe2+/Mn2+ transporter
MANVWKDLEEKALFGLVDGLNGAVGLIIGLSRSHAAAQLIFVALLARAGSSSVSMAGAQYEADDSAPNQKIRWGRVAAMGAGYLASALLPGAGFAFNLHAGWVILIPTTLAILSAITWTRAKKAGWVKAAATTALIFILAVAAGLAASLVAG